MQEYYSTKTKNKSFIYMWRQLQRMNVTNNIFMLKIYNKKLHNFSIDKMKEMDSSSREYLQLKKYIIDECKINPWFYFREIVEMDLHIDEMLMIYLYEKKCSFIVERDTDYDRIKNFLFILWNYHKATHQSTDIVVIENRKDFLRDRERINKQIVKFPILLGGSQLVSDPIKHMIIASQNGILNPVYIKKWIYDIKKNFMVQNIWNEREIGIFNFDDLCDSSFYDQLLYSKSNDTKLYLCMSSKYKPVIHFGVLNFKISLLEEKNLPRDIYTINQEAFKSEEKI